MREVRQGEVKLLAPDHIARRGSQDVCPERGLHHSGFAREENSTRDRKKETGREEGETESACFLQPSCHPFRGSPAFTLKGEKTQTPRLEPQMSP